MYPNTNKNPDSGPNVGEYQGYPPPQVSYPPPQQPGYPLPPQQGYPPVQGYYGPVVTGYPPSTGPIVNQPGAPHQQVGIVDGGWMNIPQGGINCPPGLEYLTMIDQLFVKQKLELVEVLLDFETNNKYSIKNGAGQKVYYAVEDTDCCTRNMCGSARPFDMKVLDNFKNEVLHFYRPIACSSCCFPCCLQNIEISSPPGHIIGIVQQEWSLCYPNFSVKTPSGETVLTIEGPFCTMTCCGSVDFKILSRDGNTQVGKISKNWSGIMREMFTDSDYFGISFPIDLDVKVKASLLGALFLIDFMYFERSNDRIN